MAQPRLWLGASMPSFVKYRRKDGPGAGQEMTPRIAGWAGVLGKYCFPLPQELLGHSTACPPALPSRREHQTGRPKWQASCHSSCHSSAGRKARRTVLARRASLEASALGLRVAVSPPYLRSSSLCVSAVLISSERRAGTGDWSTPSGPHFHFFPSQRPHLQIQSRSEALRVRPST